MDRPIVAVLAGGDSRRMGSDKATVVVDGETMLDRVLRAAAEIGDPVVIGRSVAPRGTPALPDARSESRGPLTGLETALQAHPGRTVVLVAVDHPYLRPATVEHLLTLEGDAVVPVDDGWEQVTCAVYRPPFLAAAAAVLDSGGRSIITALGRARTTLVGEETWRRWGEDGRSWFGVDTSERVVEAERRYA